MTTLLGLVAVAFAAWPALASATPPIWEPNFGGKLSTITNTDDNAGPVPMGTFTFPFYGTTYHAPNTIGASSNGLLTLNTTDADNSPSGFEAETGAPTIAALWADFNPTVIDAIDRGSVYGNTFNDDADPAIDRLVFTWDSAFFGCEHSPTCRGLVQIQLLENGTIIFGYDGVLTNQAVDDFGGNPIMPVVSKGGFVPPPGPLIEPPGLDLSEQIPFNGGNLIFESFRGRPIDFDLDQSNIIFTPKGTTGFTVTSPVDVAVKQKSSPAQVSSGGTATFTGTVTNDEIASVTGVSLHDSLPDAAKIVSIKSSVGSCKKDKHDCTIGNLAPGKSAKVTVKAKLQKSGTAKNRMEVSTTTPGDGHGNNIAFASVKVGK